MNRIFTTLLLCMLIMVTSKAENVPSAKAVSVAEHFYIERFDNSINTTDAIVDKVFNVNVSTTTVIYFINYKNGGWVAVSADDAVRPVIAYSFTGSYDKYWQPDNFSAWINQYSEQIYWSLENNTVADAEARSMWQHYTTDDLSSLRSYTVTAQVEPLLVSTWNQDLYYNEMCPEDSGPGGHCYAGCVPTAMGQICNYFGFPDTGTGSYSYDCPPYGTLSADFGNTNYKFDLMPVSVNTNNLETAQLLYHLGVSCDLVYGPDGSGMYNHKAAYALRTYFKYDPATQYVFRDSTTMDWDSLIITHLNRDIPMYYAGWSVPNVNGHAFVCDGHQDSTYYHFNWGWSGSYDGYFYTDNLNPGGSNFNLAQELIINCFPDTANYQYPVYFNGADTMTTLAASFDDGSGPVFNYQNNLNSSWLIDPADSVLNINLDFVRFDVDSGDSLYIYDGNDATAPLIGGYTGNTLPESIVSSSDKMFINFVTSGQDVARGWTVNYTCDMPVFCSNEVLTQLSDTISDGSGPANYQNHTTCIWMIPNNGEGVALEFLSFDTEEGHDFVTVYDGTEEMGVFSGQELPPSLDANGEMMTLVFATNYSVTYHGWSAVYSTATGINDYIKPSVIKVYPVPANDVLNVEIKGEGQSNIMLYSIDGMKIKESIVNNNSSETFNIADVPQGTYILKVVSGNNVITRKITIQH